MNDSDASTLPADNPFARESTLPYQLPPFDKIKDEHFAPALDAGMAEQRKEIDAIAQNPRGADVREHDRRDGALRPAADARERGVRQPDCVEHESRSSRSVQTEMAPKLSAHSDAIFLDAALFARVQTLYEQRASLELDPESLRLLERYHTHVRARRRAAVRRRQDTADAAERTDLHAHDASSARPCSRA